MIRFLLVALFVTVLGLVSAGAYQRGPQRELNPEGQPQGLRAGLNHRYYVWHDRDGWHLRTTTARERHHFNGEVVADDGKLQELRTFKPERNDWVKIAPNGERIFFDLTTDEGLDGFDFRSDAQALRFRLFIDGKDRPEIVFVGPTSTNPANVPFSLANPDARPRTPPPPPPSASLSPQGRPEGMQAGSTQRFLIWRNKNGVWQVRTTTAREQHNFSGEIEAEGGRIYNLQTEETERRDWVSLDKTGQNRITFTLVTKGSIDGFSFQSDARALKFRLLVDGEAKPRLVYVGATGANPASIPFTLPAK